MTIDEMARRLFDAVANECLRQDPGGRKRTFDEMPTRDRVIWLAMADVALAACAKAAEEGYSEGAVDGYAQDTSWTASNARAKWG